MEGEKSVKLDREKILIFIIILFHLVGLAGFVIPAAQVLFLKIVPFHLLLMLTVICISHINFSYRFVAFLLIVAFAGYFLEWLGVHKHVIFGNYNYGGTLGTKLGDIPLIIAVNWFLVVYATGVTLQRVPKDNIVLRLITGGLIMVSLDVVIEPVAVRNDYWHWQSAGSVLTAPFFNYVSWFAVSFLMLLIFESFNFKKQSNVGTVLLLSQFVFFGILNLLI